MNNLEAALASTVLKASLDQIAITNRGRHLRCSNATKKSLQNRFKDKVHESVVQELDPFKVAAESLNDIKLQKDINQLEIILCKTAYEVLISKSWTYLDNTLQFEEQCSQEEKTMVCQHKCNTVSYEAYQKRIAKKFTKFDVRLRLLDEIFADLKNDFKNISQINAMELSLVQRWEQTRFDQAQLLHDQDEKELSKLQKNFNHKAANEQRLIHDVETYGNIQIEDYEKQTKFWQQKYSVELAELNQKIRKLSACILLVSKNHSRHQDTFVERQQFMDAYLEQKERERRELEVAENRINSAIKIQAWWRGVMVRRHLGPYRRKKKGKKGGKKGK